MIKDNLSLNIGAGRLKKGNINIDIRKLPGIDVVCDALHLPFKKEIFEYVYLHHVIEHFSYADALILLEEIKRVLKIGGKVEISCPNFQGLGILKVWTLGRLTFFWGNDKVSPPILFPPLTGLQDYKENIHLSQWTIKLLKHYLKHTGFEIIYARSGGDYKGKYLLLRVISKFFKNRGGTIIIIGKKINNLESTGV